MRNIRLLSCVFALLLPFFAYADERSYEQARNIAEEFFRHSLPTRSFSYDLELVWTGENVDTKAGAESPALYVFDNASGPGFIIVSGDDSALPVLGYSFEHEFVTSGMPVNVKGWLNGMEEEILFARKSGMRPYPVTKASTDAGLVLRQYNTALWDQTYPYNSKCPVINGQNAYTGCVATAIAIVMKHHKWPDAGTGTIPGYVTSSYNVNVPEIRLGYAYDWDNMLSDYEGAYTEAQKDAVARLIADCGAMVKADYGPIGSEGTSAYSSDIPSAISVYMKYDQSASEYYRGSYTDEEWNGMLRKELNDNGPVLYRGQSSEGGHMFVLEAYTNKNYYGVNWGWSGYCNGYFALTSLQPEDYGSGGSGGGFTAYQSAILGLHKNQGGKARDHIEFMAFNSDVKEYRGISSSVSSFKTGVPFDVSFGLTTNHSTSEYNGRIGLAVADEDNTVKEMLSQVDIKGLPSGYGYYFDWTVTITQPVQVGDQLIAVYYDNETSSWVKIRGSREYGITDSIQLTDGKVLESTTSLRYDSARRKVTLKVAEGVSVTVYDSAGADLSSFVSASGDEMVIDASDFAGGRYKLVLQNDTEVKELYFVLGEK